MRPGCSRPTDPNVSFARTSKSLAIAILLYQCAILAPFHTVVTDRIARAWRAGGSATALALSTRYMLGSLSPRCNGPAALGARTEGRHDLQQADGPVRRCHPVDRRFARHHGLALRAAGQR